MWWSSRPFQLCSLVFLFCRDALQVFIKFVLEAGHGASCQTTNVCWEAVEELWAPNLKAPFSDCPNFTSCILFYFGDSAQATLMCMVVSQHLGQFLKEFSRCKWFSIFPSSSPGSTSWGLIVNPNNLGQKYWVYLTGKWSEEGLNILDISNSVWCP